jgi:Mce-associated membrane protein
VEDQSTDTGDLTTGAAPAATSDAGAAPAATSDAGAAPAATPQGKTARNRHRLPRIMAATSEPNTVAASEPETEVAAESETEVAAESDTEVADTVVAPRPTPDVAAESQAADEVEADGEAATDEDDATPTEPEPEPAPELVAHRPAGRVLLIAAIVAGVIFVGAAAFAGATAQPYLADRARTAQKFEVAETAANAISTLWTYAPDNIDKLPDRAARFLSGDFANEYRQFIDSIVASNKQAKVTNETQVVGAAVESLTPTEATAIVYTNSVTTSPAMKDVPSMRYLSYRLTLVPQGGRWLITKMNAVTQLDLTPRI